MKLFLLFMLISLTSFGQVNDTTLTGIYLEDKVVFLKVLKEFTHEARKEGIFIDHFISRDLGGIVYLSEEEIKKIDKRKDANSPAGVTYRVNTYDILGYWHRTPMIGIHEGMEKYGYRLIKVIIYHELGHFFGLDHLTDDECKNFNMHIMVPVVNRDYITIDIDDEAMKDYWNRLRKVGHKHYWKRASNNK